MTMTARPRPQVMSLTEAAAARIRALTAASGKEVEGVRIGVKNGGCAGMEYTMEYAQTAGPHDEVVEDKGVKLLIDPTAVLFLLGTEMDFKVDKLSSTFVFNNPNQTSACGCGESVQLTAAADRIKAIMAKADKPFVGVRVGVKNGGCAGMAYTMEYAENAEKFDEVVEDKGVKLLIDPISARYLRGAEVDFVDNITGGGFTIKNPNAKSTCGCGSSFSV